MGVGFKRKISVAGRRITAVLIMVMMVTALLPTTGLAVGGHKIAFQVGSVSAKLEPGKTVTVPISITENDGYSKGEFNVKWNKEALELTDIKYVDDVAPNDNPAPVENNGNYKLSFGDEYENFNKTGVGINLTFKITDEATAGDYKIEIFGFSIFDDEDIQIDNVATSGREGKVTLTDSLAAPKVNEYTVTFNTNGGSPVANQTVAEGGKAKKPEDPTKTGLKFDKWYENAEFTTPFNFDSLITRDTMVYARWRGNVEVHVYDVMWENTGSGGKITCQTSLDSSVSSPTLSYSADLYEGYNFKFKATPDENYHFVKWTKGSPTGEAISTDLEYENTISSEGAGSYYAVFDRDKCKVTFNTYGGSDIAAQMVYHGYWATKPTEQTEKEGYSFDGWYEDAQYTIPFSFEDKRIQKNTTVYAKWIKKNYAANVQNVDFGTVTVGYAEQVKRKVNITNTGDQYLSFDENSVTYSGANVESFEKGLDGSAGVIAPATTLDYFWVRPKTGLPSGTYTMTATFKDKDERVTASANIIFKVGEAGTTTKHTITWDSGAGTGTEIVEDLPEDEIITVKAFPNSWTEPAGKHFIYWILNDGAVVNETIIQGKEYKINSDATFTAHYSNWITGWEDTGASGVDEEKGVNYLRKIPKTDGDVEAETGDEVYIDIYLKDGYIIEDGTVSVIGADSSVAKMNMTNSVGNVWGGSFIMPDKDVSFKFATKVKPKVLTSAELTLTIPKPGDSYDYKVGGEAFAQNGANYEIKKATWFNSENGLADTAFNSGKKYFAQIELTANEGFIFDKNMTATINQETATVSFPNVDTVTILSRDYLMESCTVTFNANGGKFVGDKESVEQQVLKGEKATEPADPTLEGYVFRGWYIDPDNTMEFDFNNPVGENLTLKAFWAVNIKGNVKDTNGKEGVGGMITFGDEDWQTVFTDEYFYRNGYFWVGCKADEGYTFDHWELDGETIAETNTQFNFEAKDGPKTYTAVFKPNVHAISFNLNGGTWDGKTGTVVLNLEYNSEFTLPAPTREGYTFDYWEGSRYDAGASYTIKGDHTLTARWKQNALGTSSTGTGGGTGVSGTQAGGSASTEAVDTSDNNLMWLWSVLMAVSAFGIALVYNERRKIRR